MGFDDHFSRVAASYAAARPSYPPELFAWLASQVPRHELAWDCACGSGQASHALTRHFARVVATDASTAQVAAAPPADRLHFAVCTAHASPLPPASVDLLSVAQALHWFAGEPFFAEVRRVVAPGGLFAAWTYALPRPADAGVEELMLDFYANTVGPHWPPERQLVMEGYASIALPFHELHTPRFELGSEWTLPHFLRFLRSWSATGRYVAAHGKDPVAELAPAMQTLWGDPERPMRISWPLTVRAARL